MPAKKSNQSLLWLSNDKVRCSHIKFCSWDLSRWFANWNLNANLKEKIQRESSDFTLCEHTNTTRTPHEHSRRTPDTCAHFTASKHSRQNTAIKTQDIKNINHQNITSPPNIKKQKTVIRTHSSHNTKHNHENTIRRRQAANTATKTRPSARVKTQSRNTAIKIQLSKHDSSKMTAITTVTKHSHQNAVIKTRLQ